MPMLRLCWLLVVLAAAPAFAAAPPVVRRDLYGDPLPAGAVARLGSLWWRRSLGLHNPVVSPDGQWLVSTHSFMPFTSAEGLHVWEMTTGRLAYSLKLRLTDDDPKLRAFAFMPDGKGLLTSDWGADRLYLWTFPEGKLRWTFPGPNKITSALAIDRTGQLAAAGTCYGKVHVYDLKTRNCLYTFPGDGAIQSLAFTTDGCLSTVEAGKTESHFRVRQFDLRTREVLRRFMVGPVDGWEKQVQLSPDGRHAAAILKNEVCLWEVKSGVRRHIRLLVHEGGRDRSDEYITTLAFSPDGRTLAALGQQYAWLCDVGSARLLNRIPPPINTGLTAHLVFSRDGKMLGASDDSEMGWRDLRTGRWLSDRPNVPYFIHSLNYSQDGRSIRIATVTQDSLWDTQTGQCRLRKLRDVRSLVDRRTWVVKVLPLLLPGGPQILRIIDKHLGAMAISPDGRLLFTSCGDILRIWNLKRGRLIRTETSKSLDLEITLAREEASASLVLSPDGRFLARTDWWGSLCLHEAASGQLLHRIKTAGPPLAVAPMGWRLAAGHWKTDSFEPDSILIYDLGTLFRSLPSPRPGVQTAASLWNDLAHPDAGLAHRALWRLAVFPGMEDFLDRQFRLPPRLDEWLKQQIADLGSDDFTTREKAQQNLASAGAFIQPALKAALTKTEDLELRKRLERLLEPLDLDGTGVLRLHRAVLALEARGTPAARKVLARLAAGVSGARLTQEAKAALKRLNASGS